MSARELAALARRHLLSIGCILLVTAGVAIGFRYTQSGYKESATIALEPESFVNVEPINIDQNFLLNTSLITTCQVLAMHLSGPQGAAQLLRAGVTGSFAVSVVNSSNADTPTYPYPDLSISVADESSGGTHKQFIQAIHVLVSNIANFQAGDQLSPQGGFVTYTLSDTGPVSQRGSLVRSYAALMFIALIAIFLLCRFLDRRSGTAVTSAVS